MNITTGPVNTRNHHGWGHGLRPGEMRDINCTACRREDGVPKCNGTLSLVTGRLIHHPAEPCPVQHEREQS